MDLGTCKFRPIDKDFLLSDDSLPELDIYYFTETKGKRKPILLASSDARLSNLKEILRQKKYGQLYIKKSAVKQFDDYMEKTLLKVVDDPAIPLEKKSKFIYECASNVIKDMIEDPRSGENLSRTKNIADGIVKFAMYNTLAVPYLLRLSSHDYYTFTHCLQVAAFGLGLWLTVDKGSEEEVLNFTLGCLLHDVGKSNISDKILNKPGPLNEEEFEEIKKHTLYGYDLMADTVSEVSLDIILNHHERYDGTGYPNSLKADEISDNARIATIADVYDALTTHRPYARARDPFDALIQMKEKMVGHFEHEKFLQFVKFLGGQES